MITYQNIFELQQELNSGNSTRQEDTQNDIAVKSRLGSLQIEAVNVVEVSWCIRIPLKDGAMPGEFLDGRPSPGFD